MSAIDRTAVLRGAAVAAAVAVPAGIAQNALGRGSGLASPLLLVIMVGLGVGGYVAGTQAPDRLLVHGGAAALVVYVVVQTVGVVARLARGDEVRWLGIPFFALLSVSCGAVGGFVAFRRRQGEAA